MKKTEIVATSYYWGDKELIMYNPLQVNIGARFVLPSKDKETE